MDLWLIHLIKKICVKKFSLWENIYDILNEESELDQVYEVDVEIELDEVNVEIELDEVDEKNEDIEVDEADEVDEEIEVDEADKDIDVDKVDEVNKVDGVIGVKWNKLENGGIG